MTCVAIQSIPILGGMKFMTEKYIAPHVIEHDPIGDIGLFAGGIHITADPHQYQNSGKKIKKFVPFHPPALLL
jgi:hypothetical protein